MLDACFTPCNTIRRPRCGCYQLVCSYSHRSSCSRAAGRFRNHLDGLSNVVRSKMHANLFCLFVEARSDTPRTRIFASWEEAYAHERANAQSAGWGACFRGQALRRTQIVTGIQCLQQGQGISFMANYLVIFLLQLGVKNVYLLSVGISTLVAGLTMAGFFVQDYFGRRVMLIGGGAVMGASLITVAGLTSTSEPLTGAARTACVALSECRNLVHSESR